MNQQIGIIGAMRAEVETLIAALDGAAVCRVGSLTFHTGRLSGRPVVLAECGIGKVNAAMCAQTMILRFGVTEIWNTGVAGTLTDELSIGDFAVSSDVVQHDMDTTPLGDPPGWISGLERVHIPADAALAAAFAAAVASSGRRCRIGTIASGDVFVASSAQKTRIRDAFGAVACEMEGAAIGQVAAANGVPFVVVRAISDGGDEASAVDYPTFVKEAASRSAAVVAAVAGRA